MSSSNSTTTLDHRDPHATAMERLRTRNWAGRHIAVLWDTYVRVALILEHDTGVLPKTFSFDSFVDFVFRHAR